MEKIYAIGTCTGPLQYFPVFSDAIAYWNYIEFGDGVNPPPCDLMGLHPSEIIMYEIKLIGMDDEFMKFVNAANKRRGDIERSRRISELRQVVDPLPVRHHQT